MRALVLILTVLAATSALANPKARALAKDADKLYRDNKYQEAAEKLQAAYKLDPSPVYLYNIARALDQAGAIEDSLDTYRQYVALPSDVTSPDLVKKANLAMDRLRTLQARSVADTKINAAERERLAKDATEAQARAELEAEKASRQKKAFEAKEKSRQDAASKSMGTKKIAALALGGVGVAALGTSLTFGLLATGSRGSFDTATTVAAKREAESATRTQALVADITLVVGLGAAVTAAVLFPWKESLQGSVSVSVVPVSGGGAYATVGGSF